MIDTSPTTPSPATLNRLKASAARANRISVDSYQRLQEFAKSMPKVGVVDDQHHSKAEVDRAWFFASISREVAGLTVRISDELMFLCSVAITSGIIRGKVRQKLAKALDSAQSMPGQPVDMRQWRLRRMPIDDALRHIMDNLDIMCDQIDGLMLALTAPQWDDVTVDDIARG